MTQDCQEEAGLDRIREHKNRILALGYHGHICANCGAKVAPQDGEPPERCPLCGGQEAANVL